ncbi:MAG: permease [Candidatus Omnitrophica bacterium]|nr:permease [Candidatus Omnitrophota bacterium]
MKLILINFLEFFVILSFMFLVFSFLSQLIIKKLSLQSLFSLLDNKIKGLGNVVSALFGAVTPFCVCTTIPVFTSMIQMGVKLSVAISFLFASPLISVSGAILLVFLFGIKFSVYYILAAFIFSIIGGLLVRSLRFEGEINEKFKNAIAQPGIDGQGVYRSAANCSFKLFRDLFLPLVIGAVIASFIHNYVPVELIERINGYPLWLVIPLVALIGFPIYSNIMVLAPICYVLASKGMNQGAVVTFLMSGAGISFPTAIVLRGIFKKKLFVFYLVYTFVSYCIIGFIIGLLR